MEPPVELETEDIKIKVLTEQASALLEWIAEYLENKPLVDLAEAWRQGVEHWENAYRRPDPITGKAPQQDAFARLCTLDAIQKHYNYLSSSQLRGTLANGDARPVTRIGRKDYFDPDVVEKAIGKIKRRTRTK